MTDARPDAARVRALYSGKLPPDDVVAAMQDAGSLLPSAVVRRGDAVRDLPWASSPLGDVTLEESGRHFDLVDYLAYNRVAGLLVLADGAIAREDYALGCGPGVHWASFSLAKSVCSTLYGAALADGILGSVDDRIAKYLPALARGAYRDATLRDVLEMSSGVRWDETYTDPRSERRRFLDLQLAGEPGSLLAMMAGLDRASGGRSFNSSPGETFLAGAALAAALGRPLAAYLSATLWAPAGMEADATWWLESPGGSAIGGSGLSATLRDYGRFARFVLEDGCIGSRRVVRAGWFEESTVRLRADGSRRDYGYQWWLPADSDPVHAGAFLAMGIFGQRIYLHPARRLAIVALCARSKPSDAEVVHDLAFFAAVARALG
jgi:CubicO group peptidase (beta-lactamase class C family)